MDVNQIMNRQKCAIVCLLFPRDKTLRREWIRQIPNANFNPTKYTCVCEKHFTVEEVSRFHVIGDKQVSTVVYIYIFHVFVLYNNIIIL